MLAIANSLNSCHSLDTYQNNDSSRTDTHLANQVYNLSKKLDQSDIKQLNYKRSSQWIKKATSSKSSERFCNIPGFMENPMRHTELTFLPCLKRHHKNYTKKEKKGKKRVLSQ